MLCTWCGEDVGDDEGFRATEPVADLRAVFCRLEHIVPWAMQGAHWDIGTFLAGDDRDDGLGQCAQCGIAVGDTRVMLVRHRGAHRIADVFCTTEHLHTWARAGGRWQ
jgi:hypothetical protein